MLSKISFSIVPIFFLSFCLKCHGQNTEKLTLPIDTSIVYKWDPDFEINVEFELPACPYNIKNAVKDIENNKMLIVIRTGFLGSLALDKEKSAAFEKKYNLKLEHVGCVRLWDDKTENIVGYNEIIFEHLRFAFGPFIKDDFNSIWRDQN